MGYGGMPEPFSVNYMQPFAHSRPPREPYRPHVRKEQPIKLPDKPSAQSFSAAPQIRDLQREAASMVPAALLRKKKPK